jgi:hypothetical protein
VLDQVFSQSLRDWHVGVESEDVRWVIWVYDRIAERMGGKKRETQLVSRSIDFMPFKHILTRC